MKTTKRILSTLLALLLGLAVLAPLASAAADPNMPIVTWVISNPTTDKTKCVSATRW